MDIGAAEIRDWHNQRGWRDIGYHYVIRRNGTREDGRPVEQVGAHVKGHNGDSIGVCLVGGATTADFHRAQWGALERLVLSLLAQHPEARVSGHNDWTDEKACPRFDVRAWWGNIR